MNDINQRTRASIPRCAGAALIVFALIGLGGCGGGGGGTPSGGAGGAPMALGGDVHGGQNPVSGAQVFAYQAGSGGYGRGDLKIACTTTRTGGQFNFGSGSPVCTGSGLPATLSCPATGSPALYLLAVGGNPGAGANAALVLMAAVGNCNSLPASSFVAINEVTTVAAVWTLSHFMNCTGGSVNGIIAGCTSNSRDVGTSAGNAAGLNNAMALVGGLVNPANGVARTSSPAGVTPPAAEINTLGNILQDCVNSTGATATACVNLFSCVTPGAKPGTGNTAPCTLPAGAIAPTDTLTAALDVARNPVNNVAALFNLTSKSPAFSPALSAAPNDWTVSLNYSGGGLSSPAGIAIDASGSAWITNFNSNSVTGINAAGSVITGGSGLTGPPVINPVGITIDPTGNLWVACKGSNDVVEIGPGGAIPTFFSEFSGAHAVAIDQADNLWITNDIGGQVTFISLIALSSTDIAGGGLSGPVAVAIDAAGNVWVANGGLGANSVTEINGATRGFLSGANGYTAGGLNDPSGVAIDPAGNAWITNFQGNTVTKLNAAGLPLSGANGFTGGGSLFQPLGIAIDAAGNVWVTNVSTFSNSITEMSSTGAGLSGPAGFKGGGLSGPQAIALDAGGDVWVANTNGNSVTELVGAATPVLTPISACLTLKTGHAVCLP
jgi:streptogramin lyase